MRLKLPGLIATLGLGALVTLAQPFGRPEFVPTPGPTNCFSAGLTLELTNILNGPVPAGSGTSTLTFISNSLPVGVGAYFLVCTLHAPTNAVDGCVQYPIDTNGGFGVQSLPISNSIPGSVETVDVYAGLPCGEPFTNPVVSSCALVQPLIPPMTASNLPFNFATSDDTNRAADAYVAFNNTGVWWVTNTAVNVFYVFDTNQTISIISMVATSSDGVSYPALNIWYSTNSEINTTNWLMFGSFNFAGPLTNAVYALTNCPPVVAKELMFQPATVPTTPYYFYGIQAYGNPDPP